MTYEIKLFYRIQQDKRKIIKGCKSSDKIPLPSPPPSEPGTCTYL